MNAPPPVEIYKGCKSKLSEIQYALENKKIDQDELKNIRIAFEFIHVALEADRPNEFKDAAQKVVRWLRRASDESYLTASLSGAAARTTPFDVFKKGIDVLNLLLQRDLRKQKLAGGESQVYYGFLDIIRQIPAPPTLGPIHGSPNEQIAS